MSAKNGNAFSFSIGNLLEFCRMNKKVFWLSLIAVAVSFAGGFLLANALNRKELAFLRSENERLKSGPANNDTALTLTDEEIRKTIAEADQNPQNFSFQKNRGLALYRYAATTKDANLLAEAARILLRAHELETKDYAVIVGLGNTYFDIGYFKKDNDAFQKSREIYQKALEQKPADADVRTDLGLTYFLQNPPNYEKSMEEFQKSLKANPKHEKTLQYSIQTLLRQNNVSEAEKFLTQLKNANPNNESLAELASQISLQKNNQNQ